MTNNHNSGANDPMAIYKKINDTGNNNLKDEANAFMNSLTQRYTKKNPAPNEVIYNGLEQILAKHDSHERLSKTKRSEYGLMAPIYELWAGAYAVGAAVASYILPSYNKDPKMQPAH